jgi:hypothetical protein
LLQKLQKSEKEKELYREQKVLQEKNSKIIINQLKNQLYSGLRRINFLIEEKKKLEADNEKRYKYTSKLEYQIMQESQAVKDMRKKLRDVVLMKNIQFDNTDTSIEKLPLSSRENTYTKNYQSLYLLILQS